MEEFIDRITLGDFYKLINRIPNNSVDLIATDPPYRIHAKSGGGLHNQRNWLKNVHNSDLDEFDPVIFLNEAVRVLKKFNIYIFCSKDLLVDYISFAKEMGYNWDLLIMGKRNPIPTKNNKYLSDIEYIVYIRERGACFNDLKGKINFDKYRKVKMTSVKSSEYGHPTEKPLHIMQQLIEISSLPDSIVMDPFMGSGTTAVACRNLNRRFIGFEINEEFYEMANKKLNGLPSSVSLEQTFFSMDE
jgi:DNA modification methylase